MTRLLCWIRPINRTNRRYQWREWRHWVSRKLWLVLSARTKTPTTSKRTWTLLWKLQSKLRWNVVNEFCKNRTVQNLCNASYLSRITELTTNKWPYICLLILIAVEAFNHNCCYLGTDFNEGEVHPWKHLVNRLDSLPMIVKKSFRVFSGCFARRFWM